MAHCLRALVCSAAAARAAQSKAPSAVMCELPQGYVLLPLPDEMLDAAPALAAGLSMHGPTVYVETDYFGGQGAQSARVWIDGEMVLALADTPDAPARWPDSPISRALRHVGVVAADGQDEFDALGLGRHRHTEDWR